MAPTASWSSTVGLPDELASASQARRFVRRRLGEHMPAYPVDDVELVVSELVTNALQHARPPITVRLRLSGQTLRVDVKDGTRTPPVQVAARRFAVRGRGLTLVSILSRDWGVSPSTTTGKAVWAEFDVP